MDTKVKHRIIGLVVLIALIVIFLPMLIKKEHYNDRMVIQAPSKPKVTTKKFSMSNDTTPNVPVYPITKPSIATKSTVMSNRLLTYRVKSKLFQAQAKNGYQSKNGSIKSTPVLATQSLIKTHRLKNKITTGYSSQSILRTAKFINPRMIEQKKISYQHVKQITQLHAQAWVVQIGSFSSIKHAQKLVAKLKSKGFKAFNYRAFINHNSVNRVYIGPVVYRKQAQTLKEKLKSIMKLKGIIVEYEPIKL